MSDVLEKEINALTIEDCINDDAYAGSVAGRNHGGELSSITSLGLEPVADGLGSSKGGQSAASFARSAGRTW